MLFPSFFNSAGDRRSWSLPRAAAYGAAIGALAAAFKLFALHRSAASGTPAWEIATVALAFAVLCGGAAALRNFLARRLIWRA
jgi:hypothetical protein